CFRGYSAACGRTPPVAMPATGKLHVESSSWIQAEAPASPSPGCARPPAANAGSTSKPLSQPLARASARACAARVPGRAPRPPPPNTRSLPASLSAKISVAAREGGLSPGDSASPRYHGQQMTASTADSLGELGLPAPISDLAAKSWDAIIVGAGHNGLACAAYLARAGRSVLVLESRARVGGACTIEEPFPGVRMSPCAYLAGLLHPLVIEELDLPRRGFAWTPAVNGLFVPFLDGSSVQLWDDDERCEAEIRGLSPRDVPGWRAMNDA